MTRQYATEEEVENAFDAYLALKLPGTIARYVAGDGKGLTYPCVQIFAHGNDNINESAGWNIHRAMEVDIVLGVEAKDEKGADGVTVKTLRELNAELRESVLEALTVSDLPAQLNSTGHARISLVVFGKIERQTEGNIMETRIPLGVTV